MSSLPSLNRIDNLKISLLVRTIQLEVGGYTLMRQFIALFLICLYSWVGKKATGLLLPVISTSYMDTAKVVVSTGKIDTTRSSQEWMHLVFHL